MESLTWDVIVAAMVSGIAVVPVLQFLKWLEHLVRGLPPNIDGYLDIWAVPATLVLSIILPIMGNYLAGIPEPDPMLLRGILVLIAWGLSQLGYNVARAIKRTAGGLGS